MAFIHGKGAAIVHGANPLTSFLNDGSISQDIVTAETTAFGAAGGAKTYIVGLRDATLSASGMFDGAADAEVEVMKASAQYCWLKAVLPQVTVATFFKPKPPRMKFRLQWVMLFQFRMMLRLTAAPMMRFF